MALVLSRRIGERIRLKLSCGRCIWVKVQRADRGQAQIVIDAPRDVQIDREEIIRETPDSHAGNAPPATRAAHEASGVIRPGEGRGNEGRSP